MPTSSDRQGSDEDPFLWLEEIEGAAALHWVEAQNAATLAKFANARFTADSETLEKIFDRKDRLPSVVQRGRHLYNFWQDAKNPRGIWRRTSMESFRSELPEWEVVLDIDALAAAEGEDWIWSGAVTLPGSHDRALLNLSRGGSDAVVLREFDLASRSFPPDGFSLPEAKGSAEWLDRDTLLLRSAFGAGMATASGYARTIRVWQRGADVSRLPVIFAVAESSVSTHATVDRTTQPPSIQFFDRIGFYDVALALGDRTGPRHKLDLPTDVNLDVEGGWIAVFRRTSWTIGETTYAPETVLGISVAAFLRGGREFQVLYEPGERRALEAMFWCDGRLILSILDELNPIFEAWTPSEGGWQRSRIGGLPEIGVVGVRPLHMDAAESNGDLIATLEDPLTPPSMMLVQPGRAPELLKAASRAFSPDNLVVTRHEAIAIDGERIPYTQIGSRSESGDAPVHMTGYGGFSSSFLPAYRSAIGKLWLERGGTSVIAHIRGGGEFGTRWHEAGRREGKWLAHDDFAAVAADLVRRGVTRPGRIAAEGASNGGLLITNMLTRYPQLFGALFCTIPLIDMRRYHRLLAGASWVAEYGDPDNPDDWRFIQTFSPYQLAAPGQPYPPILLATARKDDRVHPGHARKFAARLQAMGHQAWFYEPSDGGHGYGKDNRERARFMALGYNFLREAIGWRVD